MGARKNLSRKTEDTRKKEFIAMLQSGKHKEETKLRNTKETERIGLRGGHDARIVNIQELDECPWASAVKGCEQRGEFLSSCVEQYNKAIQKAEEGTYGICSICGGHIEKGRLKIFPFTNFCCNNA